ncbi:MAG: carbon storage regulator [Planctomycetaceae bacterium]|nr:carbon storage regulator [Planctomycetaceae bacterium]
MLVLTRKLQQQIKIGEQITVTILRVKGQTVRVGIDAPRDVRVIRGELPREGKTAANESTIIEARLTISDDAMPGSDPDGAEIHPDDTAEAAASGCATPAALRSPSPVSPAPLRLPQRKRFSRTENPPLRVAHHASPSLAK